MLWAVVGVLLALLAETLAGVPVPGWGLAAALLVLAGAVTVGVVSQASGVFARPLVRVQTSRPEVALTFDDGPDAQVTPLVMAALEARGHRGTFFVIGDRARSQQDLIGQLVRRGHGLGNHSLRHSSLTPFTNPRTLAAELGACGDLIEAAAGQRPRWFRPPVGLLSPRVAEGAARAGLDLVAWTASARDGRPGRSVAGALARIEPHLKPGAILVLHDGRLGAQGDSSVLLILEAVLDRLEALGLRSVRLDRLVDPGQP